MSETENSQEINEYKEQILRLRADFENAKKRLEKEKLEAIRFANEQMLIEILPIVDNLDRAMTSIGQGHPIEKVEEGLKIAQSELHAVLEEYGVEIIKSVGGAFDPKVHEAIAVVDTKDFKEGEIVDEVQKGYLLNGRLIRPSRVRVAKHSG